MKNIQEAFEKGYTYKTYTDLVNQLHADGKSTGPVQNENTLHYSEMNIARMNRWNKHLKVLPEAEEAVKGIKAPQRWLVLTEGWCGDAAHSVPVMAALADLNPNIELKVILRDEHLEIMDAYLTNGGRSIPKLIAMDENFEELFNWGPRPADATKIVELGKQNLTETEEVKKQLQLWYSRNKGVAVQQELVEQVEK